ncbi:hypothetical protein BDR03DRAFT_1004521 [Suillus americanus]|nr:hypothetical protein BDR03DRAFT_1004521 [Suillus americanus]
MPMAKLGGTSGCLGLHLLAFPSLPPHPPSFVYSPTASPLIASGLSQIPAGPLLASGSSQIPAGPLPSQPEEEFASKHQKGKMRLPPSSVLAAPPAPVTATNVEEEPDFEEVRDFSFDADLELALSRSLVDLMPVPSVSTAMSSSSPLVTSSSQLPAMWTISKDPKSVTQPSGKAQPRPKLSQGHSGPHI